ncbi:3-hydroxyisobutyryl-CoA hydrolase-like protein 5 [Cinnamomum micranthum f. kanehirae]|uniref:3-hydroxyisobutyryl-CoA hydrolase n=1 Tax=Cinnamomum micranthum f. kanehirae TaxID=337451 RepID=A0A3S3NI84_9MAGN|nr:3-hydroxyisobutyryl-CoA hydrolase-like protein 5 [Cinnamomum micranthum f. kanehirae]
MPLGAVLKPFLVAPPVVFETALFLATLVTAALVVLAVEVDYVKLITLNRPRQLNVISSKVVLLLAGFLEKWEKEDDAELVIIKANDSCLEVVYRMYWLCYHIHTYKKTQVALVHGIVMGGGGSLTVPLKFSVVTEKTVFAVPEASIGFHTDCSFSYILSHLPGHLGEYLALTGARLNGKEMVVAGLATHFVPSEKLAELEKRLISLNSGNEIAVKSVIEEFSLDVKPDEESILNKQSTINKCFDKDSVEEIIKSFEAKASIEGNGWINAVLKGLKRSSPTGLKITLRSVTLEATHHGPLVNTPTMFVEIGDYK